MAKRYGVLAAGLLGTASVIGGGLYVAPDGLTARALIGAGTSSYVDPLTTNGDLVVRSGGATGRLGTSGAPDGGVLTVANGAPQWAAPAAGSAQPATLAAYARTEALRRRGPLAMRSTVSTGTTYGTTTNTQPSIVLNTSGVLTVYSPQTSYPSGGAFGQNGVWGQRGWYMSYGPDGTPVVRIGLMLTPLQTINFPHFINTIGWHSVAWSIAADGNSVRYSIDGGAIGLATLSTTPLTPVARDPADVGYIGTNNSTAGTSPVGLAYLAFWAAPALVDGDLILLSSDPDAGAPDLTGISGAQPAWEWAAAAFSGSEAVTINGTVHSIYGAPQIWTP